MFFDFSKKGKKSTLPGDVFAATHIAPVFVPSFCLAAVAVSCARFLLSAKEFFVAQRRSENHPPDNWDDRIHLQDWAETLNHQMLNLRMLRIVIQYACIVSQPHSLIHQRWFKVDLHQDVDTTMGTKRV